MLYSLYEAQHTALAPWRSLAEFSRGWYGNPFSPFAHLPMSRRMAASSDLFLRLTGRYEKPEWNCGEFEVALDDISGNGQTEAAHALCLNIPRARREHFRAPGVGHYGIFSGRRWREIVFPKVSAFIKAHT